MANSGRFIFLAMVVSLGCCAMCSCTTQMPRSAMHGDDPAGWISEEKALSTQFSMDLKATLPEVTRPISDDQQLSILIESGTVFRLLVDWAPSDRSAGLESSPPILIKNDRYPLFLLFGYDYRNSRDADLYMSGTDWPTGLFAYFIKRKGVDGGQVSTSNSVLTRA